MLKPEVRNKYQVDIGIECHVQLKTKSKLFCSCGNDAREAEPNTLVCEICLGLPGTLPYLNEQAVWLAIRAGLALNGKIAKFTKFDRKNYFYPDLPKGYQITQFDQPIVGKGHVDVPMGDSTFTVGITRAHMEEDAGKLVHPPAKDYSLVDLNRAGTPLLEIVSEPDIHSPAQAKAYTQELHKIMRYADVSEVDLYYGNMRFDVNTSVRLKGAKKLGTRTEAKNLNSFRNVERAAEFEIERQIELLEKGESIKQETRGWDDAKGKTTSQRSKEEADEYRYFPEPDLPPLVITEAMLTKVREELPPTPSEIRKELSKDGIADDVIETLLDRPTFLDTVREVAKETDKKHVVRVANWIKNDINNFINEPDAPENFDLTHQNLIELSELVEDKKLSSTNAKEVLRELVFTNKSVDEITKERNLLQVSDSGAIEKIVDTVIKNNEKAVVDYRAGNENSLKFLVGQVMRESKGQANPSMAQELLLTKLK